MAQQGGSGGDASRSKGRRGKKGRTQPGSLGVRGKEGERYQQAEMGAHPAYGDPPPEAPREVKEEDYGARGRHRRAGTRAEGLEERGIGHAEDYDARYGDEAFQARRKGKDPLRGQNVRERDAADRRDGADKMRAGSSGYSEVEDNAESGEGDIDISPGAAGGRKKSKRDPAS